ncbi:sigma-54 interaction domain-containing protein [Paramaledivibacter caminithermalis]|uniref:Transcriptional regulator containing PAS, AAA-type ATPase, and DNA-binding Fis domains n=1 Tax=Paramaledivibacter caminithermalis (strain DSM 15212 / CIP 107654 / DViRD3) TaxID=1121301 RepID=A0A1M6QKS0_PARC5|nr:sigma 54-interacting transcriptional regulator [Paramaledivibacter caminithermalis]SHK20765.1 Transcriptional regulator containing PAS, AAA-type ATPase, and DNA-binding Fis domains [Paramaledivibacter caminithermalis DSM 15212]
MSVDMDYINQFTDMMSEGFIFIDNDGKIQLYNKKAKEVFGVIYNQGKGHESGRILKGDIVIIADNNLGRDDGGLSPQNLSMIGIEDESIDYGDSIIAIGCYKDNKNSSIYKYTKNYKQDSMSLRTNFLDVQIDVSIDFIGRIINITVNNEIFQIEYINAIGHMVVLDGKTGRVKFYQANGYTIRRESIFDLLMGKEYMAKGQNLEVKVIGRDIFEIHGNIPAIKEFYETAKGKNFNFKDKFIEINGRPTLCSLAPVNRKGKRVGALLKVKDISELKKLIEERNEAILKLEEIENKIKKGEKEIDLFPNIIGESDEIKEVKNLLYKASKSNSTILLLGESGTGKGLMAKSIHEKSKNRDNPFIHVNCGSIPEGLIESELFGYEEGSFTGAKAKGKIGFFEMAKGGTIFLDEIAEIPLPMQVKLLQVLQSKTFFRVGGTKEIKVDVRIIAATNRNLEEEVLNGRFREDLFYRINVFPIWIPPLRERKQDIYPIVHYKLPEISRKAGYEEKHISGQALRKLKKYAWPGNIRELENILERAVILCEGNTILSEHLKIETKDGGKKNKGDIKTLKEAVMDAEKKVIIEVLRICDGDKKKAMSMLDIGKTSFYDKLKKYNVNVQ